VTRSGDTFCDLISFDSTPTRSNKASPCTDMTRKLRTGASWTVNCHDTYSTQSPLPSASCVGCERSEQACCRRCCCCCCCRGRILTGVGDELRAMNSFSQSRRVLLSWRHSPAACVGPFLPAVTRHYYDVTAPMNEQVD